MKAAQALLAMGGAVPPRWNPVVRAGVFVLCLVPFLALSNAVITNSLGPDPAEQLMHVTGEWVMRFMVLVPPLRRSHDGAGHGLPDIGACLVCMYGFMQHCTYLCLLRST